MCPPAGPTPETISDFWQMIWDVRPAVIVMLTNVNENGRVRAELCYIRITSCFDVMPYTVEMHFMLSVVTCFN